MNFSKTLINWNRGSNRRQMPWKGEKDPYRIWLSEIILQQTRVEQGRAYYEKFIKTFPTVISLAKARDTAVFKLWEGLGYYSRCRNLLTAAKYIDTELHGKFPKTYEEILNLKGVGPYTAAAISSFAFNLPYAVVDGNVMRVLARYFGITESINSPAAKKHFEQLATKLLDKKEPGEYNQAIMDFGATVCKPAQPLCQQCPFKKKCFAFAHNKTGQLPVKAKKPPLKKRWFNYFIITDKKNVYIKERLEKDIWKHLWEFPLVETKKETAYRKLIDKKELKIFGKGTFAAISPIVQVKQKLSHQEINATFVMLQLKKLHPVAGYKKISLKSLSSHAFPKAIVSAIEKCKQNGLNVFGP